jgi:5-methyltetrahydropteroyltriglutamate--homocysteine methyltransferase
MEGMAISVGGWVQCLGSLCVKPPLLFGDIKRKSQITVDKYKTTQSLSQKPVKPILPGPITLLNWSYVREDQAREKSALQLAFAIREEFKDLEMAGAKFIQIDEPAIREGLPMKRLHWQAYLKWVTAAFRLATTREKPQTDLHLNVWYSKLSDILIDIDNLGVDLLYFEQGRTGGETLVSLKKMSYPRAIAPGFWNASLRRSATIDSIDKQAQFLVKNFKNELIWLSPDAGLRAGGSDEMENTLRLIVNCAKELREKADEPKVA